MKTISLIVSLLIVSCFSLKAEETIRERVYIHTDKDCYISGEVIRLKFYVIFSNFQPSTLSKVGYIEICDTEKPHIQMKVALESGSGAGHIKIPAALPSGIYELSGYTRYMRNEGDDAFFKKQIAIINVQQQSPDPDRFEVIEKFEDILPVEEQPNENEPSNLLVYTDQNEYGNRKKVVITVNNIPANAADLVISVSRNDSITFSPRVDKLKWLNQVKNNFLFSQQWLPEYEGHIISGSIVPKPQEQQLLSSIAFSGKDIRYFNGKINTQNGIVDFFTAGIFDRQQIVTSVISPTYNKVPHRLDLISPFCESLPGNLPALQIYSNEKQLIDRYIGIQIDDKAENDSFDYPIKSSDYTAFQPLFSYDLDEYTRFNSIRETILEFINWVRVFKIENTSKIKVYLNESQRFSLGNTLVLLDGIPIYDHDEILKYNPMHIKKINVYDGRYLFGGNDLECIVSFITYEGDLPFFQLSEGSQLLQYDCPQLPVSFEIPDYSIDKILHSRKPDFRHTLYWNPFVKFTKDQPVNLSFYTSDLCGEFKVTVEGITSDGKIINGTSFFHVTDFNE